MSENKDKSWQYRKHEAGKSPQKRMGQLALNDFGRPEAFFTYGKDDGSALEFTVDVDFAEQRLDTPKSGRAGLDQKPKYGMNVVGAQFLCPRCYSALYVKGKSIPDGREIQVHWDDLQRSHVDGLLRPTISIDGVLKCDYYGWETGDGSGRLGFRKGTSNRCGWQGGLWKGKMYDHHESGAVTKKAQIVSEKGEVIFSADPPKEKQKTTSAEITFGVSKPAPPLSKGT